MPRAAERRSGSGLPLRGLLLFACFLILLGGVAKVPLSSRPGARQSDEISGGERIAWSQEAPSRAALRSYVFKLYVDGRLADLTDVRCDETRSAGGYECSGVLPRMISGAHSLQVAAVNRGVESARSSALVIRVTRHVSDREATEKSGPRADRRLGPARVCFEKPAASCYIAQEVAGPLGQVSRLTSLPDGRLLFVENGRRIRALTPAGLLEEPALTVAENDTITGVAVHPAYSDTRILYVAVVTALPSGETIRVVRYRDVGDLLGEPATVISDFPVASSDVPIAVGTDGSIYLASPRDRRRLLPAGSEYAGMVLRFDERGAVPRDSRANSPIFSQGYDRPAAIAAGTDSEVWIAGTGGTLRGNLASVDARQTEWPRQPSTTSVQARDASGPFSGLSVFREPSTGFTIALFVGGKPPLLHRVTIDPQKGPSAAVSLRLRDGGALTEVSAMSLDRIYVATVIQAGSGERRSHLLRLTAVR